MTAPRPVLTPWQRLSGLVQVFPPEYAELQSGGVALGMGLWYLWPGVNTFGSTTAFQILAKLGGESFWGETFVLMGLAQVGALLYDVRLFRMVLSELAGAIWMFIAVVLCLGNPRSPSLVIFGSYSVLMFLALLQIARER